MHSSRSRPTPSYVVASAGLGACCGGFRIALAMRLLRASRGMLETRRLDAGKAGNFRNVAGISAELQIDSHEAAGAAAIASADACDDLGELIQADVFLQSYFDVGAGG